MYERVSEKLRFLLSLARKLAYYFVSVRTFVYFALVVSLFSLLILGEIMVLLWFIQSAVA